MSDRGTRRQDVWTSFAVRVRLLVAGLGVLAAACGESAPYGKPEATAEGTRAVFRDGDDWADDAGAHPQVIRITGPAGGTCTAWLSSSNTLTTNAHCLASGSDFVGWTYDPTQRNYL